MNCPHCHTDLVRITSGGAPMIQNRGLLVKGGTLIMVCPSCKGDVPATPAVMKSLHQVAVLFFSRDRACQKPPSN